MSQTIANGTTVRVKNPEEWQSHVSTKITNRDGVVKSFREGDRAYIVDFPAIGRRKAFTHQFYERNLIVIEQAIAPNKESTQ